MQKSRTQARVAPPAVYQGTAGCLGWTKAAVVAAVVEMVRVAVPALEPVMLTGLVEPKLKVGGYAAPVGLLVIAAVRATAPVKPPLGVSVMVEVLPVGAPGATETDVPAIARPGTETAVTVTPVML
jgi:hypothetical protein